MKTKTFDCVEMKRVGAKRVYQLIKDLTPDEELEFWRHGTEKLRQEIMERRRSALISQEKNHRVSS
jgi:hypothetical protein